MSHAYSVYCDISLFIICADMTIGFEKSSYTVMEGYTVRVCFNAIVQGTVNRDVMVNISTADNSTMGERYSQVLL